MSTPATRVSGGQGPWLGQQKTYRSEAFRARRREDAGRGALRAVWDVLVALAYSIVSLIVAVVLIAVAVLALPWLLLLPVALVGLLVSAVGLILGP